MVSATLASWSPKTDWASANQSARNSGTASTAENPGARWLNVNPRVDFVGQPRHGDREPPPRRGRPAALDTRAVRGQLLLALAMMFTWSSPRSSEYRHL